MVALPTPSLERAEWRASPRNISRLLKGEIPWLVSSHEGTDQYSRGASAACGLAALNSVRIILGEYRSSDRSVETLEWMTSKENAEEIIAISAGWTIQQYLEVEDVSELPLFKQCLSLKGFDQKLVQRRNFSETLRIIQKMSESTFEPTAIAAVITRPPEIFTVFYIPTPDARLAGVFAIYDSHPRHTYGATGASVMLFSTLESASNYLISLCSRVEERTLPDDLQWQAQSHDQYSSHIFKVKDTETIDATGDAMKPVYQANLDILKLSIEMKSTHENTNQASLEKRLSYLKKSCPVAERRMNPPSYQAVSRTNRDQYYSSSPAGPSQERVQPPLRTNTGTSSSQRSDPRSPDQHHERVDRDPQTPSHITTSRGSYPFPSSQTESSRARSNQYYTSSPLHENMQPRSKGESSPQRSDERPAAQERQTTPPSNQTESRASRDQYYFSSIPGPSREGVRPHLRTTPGTSSSQRSDASQHYEQVDSGHQTPLQSPTIPSSPQAKSSAGDSQYYTSSPLRDDTHPRPRSGTSPRLSDPRTDGRRYGRINIAYYSPSREARLPPAASLNALYTHQRAGQRPSGDCFQQADSDLQSAYRI
ncbi:hypothetical protein BU17DRAFT_68259 [Hysterangium stoloniferum]|nr:hypothetical protein BU17DRAFT_68259 [Hysterangium stoloniferum]